MVFCLCCSVKQLQLNTDINTLYLSDSNTVYTHFV